ncbi:MAG TPA: hypothetical protein VMT58_05195 [Candidatus Binataceae bacterium]|nr:hypothetical protein [Candidatus Binataceae bacterium]
MAAFVAAALPGCYASFPAPQPPPPTSVTTWGPMGGMSINTGSTCAGQVALIGGLATVSDACFTSSTNVVLCTDTTAANPVQCAAGPGALDVSGTGGDVVAYARLK